MNINVENIKVILEDNKESFVNLKWMRGAIRYNNGGTIYMNKFPLRLIFGRLKNKTITQKK